MPQSAPLTTLPQEVTAASRTEARAPATALAGGLLFASGIAALIYQVIWVRQLSLIVGIDVYAVALVVGAFFAGLGTGSYLLGLRADRSAQPLRLYALLELGCALGGVLTTFALAHGAASFVRIEAVAGPIAWLLPFLAIGLPALLMGGTLPVLLRACAPAADRIGAAGGRLYALNTCGAVLGALLVTFLLIPRLGVFNAALCAAALNLVLALLASTLRLQKLPDAIVLRAPIATSAPVARNRALIIYAIAGGIALGYEVVWSQAAIQFMSTRSFAFTIVLATYLCGLMLGSALFARRADRLREPWSVFALLIAAAGFLALLQLGGLGAWLPQLQTQLADWITTAGGSQLAAMCARFALAAICIVLGPTLLLGAAFPVALRLVASENHLGRDSGRVLAFNTFGGIAGSLLAGFVLLPALGLIHTLALLAIAATALGGYALWQEPTASVGPRLAFAGIALSVACTAIAVPPQRLAQLLTAAHPGTLRYYGENPGGTVAVIEQDARSSTFRRLYIQGVSNSGDAMPSLRYMRLQALLPLLIQRDEPRSALVIALGTGITAGALTQYPGLEKRVCAELLPAVVDAATLFSGNYGVVDDARVDIRVRDGRRELLRNPDRYDLITLEPPPPSAAGVANLYSRDFYELARTRLQPGGLFAQWLPLATQNDEDTRALVRSFLDAFPYATLWTTELHETLLIGSLQPIELDADRIARRFAQPSVHAALREVGIDSPQALLATWLMDRVGLESYAAASAPVTDDRPLIEYGDWLRSGEFARVLPQLLALRSAPPLRATPEFSNGVEAERSQLLTFYTAGLHAYRGDRAQWGEALQSIATAIDTNPYYRWTIKGF